jgi:hypothetical protein
MGFQFVTSASDTGLLEAGAATSVRAYRAARAADTSDASAPSPLPY